MCEGTFGGQCSGILVSVYSVQGVKTLTQQTEK